MTEKLECSRRMFLTAGAVGALSGATGSSIVKASGFAEEQAESVHSTGSRFEQPGYPTRGAEWAWAEAEYDHLKQMREGAAQQGSPDGGNQSGSGLGSPTSPNFNNVVNAVDDLGADPTGNRPISQDVSSAIQPGTLILFPPGDYLLDQEWGVSVDGTFGMAGKGYKQASNPPKSDNNAATFVAADNTHAAINFEAETGLLANFVLDQTGNNNSISILLRSSGFVQARDLRYVGTQDNTGSQADEDQSNPMCRFAADEGATARAERLIGKYIGLPGDKNSGGAPFFWVGESNKGTAQMGNCVSVGAADNGLYGGRTPGHAQVKGGKYVNNAVSQLRYDGADSWADGVSMVVDADNYSGPTNGTPYNKKFGVQGLKTERRKYQEKKPSGAVLRNADVRVRSINSNMGAPIYIRGWGGSLKIENSRIVNQLDQTTILAEAPGDGFPATQPPHNITITESEIVSSYADPVIDIRERENSSIRNTCIKVPGAGPGSINGMDIGENVGFGKQCKKGGLRAPDKVGASGNLSEVNFSAMDSGNSSFGENSQQRQQKRRKQNFLKRIVSGIFTMFLLIALVVLGGVATLFYLIFGD